MLRAVCFTLLACGYRPRCALDVNDSGRNRFETILDILGACDLSIHDISRVELDPASGLPRFNMPLELGADLGLRLRGPKSHRKRRVLVLDAEAHRYDLTTSDLHRSSRVYANSSALRNNVGVAASASARGVHTQGVAADRAAAVITRRSSEKWVKTWFTVPISRQFAGTGT
jgi:hypothetical protein